MPRINPAIEFTDLTAAGIERDGSSQAARTPAEIALPVAPGPYLRAAIANPGNAGITPCADLIRDTELRVSQGGDMLPAELQATTAVAQDLNIFSAALEAQISSAVGKLSKPVQQQAQMVNEALNDVVAASTMAQLTAAVRQQRHPDVRHLAGDLAQHMQALIDQRQQEGLPPPELHERRSMAADFLSKLLRNEFEGTLGRCTSNLSVTALRAGVSTFAGTSLRNVAGFFMQQTINAAMAANNGDMPAWTKNMVIGMDTGLLLLPFALHLAGIVRDYRSGAATGESVTDRFLMASMSTGATAFAISTGHMNPLMTLSTMSVIYAANRATAGMMGRYDQNNAGEPSTPGQLAMVTGIYAGVQTIGSFVQDSLGWNSGASSPNIALKANGQARSPAEINGASHQAGANIGHSALNAGIEISDDVVVSMTSRWWQTAKAKYDIQNMKPEQAAQLYAAGLHAMVRFARMAQQSLPLEKETLGEAALAGIGNHLTTELEGARISFSRQSPSSESIKETLNDCVNQLTGLGLKWTPNADRDSIEHMQNLKIAAYIGQAMHALKMNQPLERPFGIGSGTTQNRIANQVLNVEPMRLQLFQTIFALLSSTSGVLPADTHPAAQNALGAAVLGLTELAVYPTFTQALVSRRPRVEDQRGATARQQQIDAAHSRVGAGDDDLQGVTVITAQPENNLRRRHQ